ncbi:MAG: hypothetical protein C4B59_14445 [Candidatus Methanogaster sp.]|uniref:Uncharacterized protein n=1 Tax=Candidatus Methanogaster sp. TaxID=3386292 RepID=A0AC61KZ26_9EURY|nr:MAG: hypothetical protein C4B59_14445 [ANME-2 cluster archaeon]
MERLQMKIEPDYKRTFPKVQHMPNGGTPIFYIFIGAEVVEPLLDDVAELSESETGIVQVILLETVKDEEHPTTGHRWYYRVKDSVEYISKNWGPLVFVLDKFCGM